MKILSKSQPIPKVNRIFQNTKRKYNFPASNVANNNKNNKSMEADEFMQINRELMFKSDNDSRISIIKFEEDVAVEDIGENTTKINQPSVEIGGVPIIVSPMMEEGEEGLSTENIVKKLRKEYDTICEFEPFSTHTMTTLEKSKKFKTSCYPENLKKNRYQDILCDEETRFKFVKKDNKLSKSMSSMTKDVNPEIDEEKFINANYINGLHQKNSKFISTQAPLESTMSEFYEMIWQSKSKIIISLTSLIEKNKIKMIPFWPIDEPLSLSNFQVELLEEKSLFANQLTLRTLSIKNTENDETRQIIQIHYTGWPDHGLPKDLDVITQIYLYQKQFEKQGKSEGLDGPVCVHCSAGIGRTGTYMAFAQCSEIIDFLHERNFILDSELLNFNISIPSIVINLRKQRHGSVQTWKQYAFIYKIVNYYLKNFCK